MLHRSLDEAALRARWAAEPCLRVGPFLADDVAADALASLRAQPFDVAIPAAPEQPPHLFWRYAYRPEPGCDHALCRLGRFLQGAWVGWASRVTGIALAPPPDGLVVATAFVKGNYLDLHDDWDGRRAVAYVIGLTPEPWDDPAVGGHLELLDPDAVRVRERRPPGWNTLDLFDVRRKGARPHRVPILRERRERRAISGWLYTP